MCESTSPLPVENSSTLYPPARRPRSRTSCPPCIDQMKGDHAMNAIAIIAVLIEVAQLVVQLLNRRR